MTRWTALWYVFVSRRGAQMRVLYFDRSGFCVWGKRLETGRFISDWNRVHAGEMNWTQLKLLIEGIEPGGQRKRYQHTQMANKPCICAPLSTAMG